MSRRVRDDCRACCLCRRGTEPSLFVFLTRKHVRVTVVRVAHMLCFLTDCVSIDRREAGGDKRRTEAAHHRARGHVRRAGSPLQLHTHLLCLRYQSISLASWFPICTQISPVTPTTLLEVYCDSCWFGGHTSNSFLGDFQKRADFWQWSWTEDVWWIWNQRPFDVSDNSTASHGFLRVMGHLKHFLLYRVTPASRPTEWLPHLLPEIQRAITELSPTFTSNATASLHSVHSPLGRTITCHICMVYEYVIFPQEVSTKLATISLSEADHRVLWGNFLSHRLLHLTWFHK